MESRVFHEMFYKLEIHRKSIVTSVSSYDNHKIVVRYFVNWAEVFMPLPSSRWAWSHYAAGLPSMHFVILSNIYCYSEYFL